MAEQDKPKTGGEQISGQQIFHETDAEKHSVPESDIRAAFANRPFGQSGGGSQTTANQTVASGAGQQTQTAPKPNEPQKPAEQKQGEQKQSEQAQSQQPQQPSESAKQTAAQVTEVLRGNTQGVTEAAKTAVGQAKDAVGQAATQIAGKAQEQAATVLDQQKHNLTEGLGGVADNIRTLGDNLGKSESPIADVAAKYSGTLADQVDNLAHYFEQRNIGDLAGDLQTFARRNPTLFVGAAFTLGLLAARLIKSNPRQELMVIDRDYGRRDASQKTSNDKKPKSNATV